MATTAAGGFSEFGAKIQPTAAQASEIRARRSRVGTLLGELFPATSSMPLEGVYLIGSAARNTIIRPIDDVDVFALFVDDQVWPSYRHDSTKLLYRVRDALNEKFKVTLVGARGQAVRLFYNSGPHVDIAPGFRVDTGGYYIPSGGGGWIQTDPFQHNDFLKQRNEDLAGNLKPLIRLLKRWNTVHSSRFKSFHLENVAQASFGGLGASMRSGLQRFFEWAPQHLDVSDPAGYSGNLAADWSFNHRMAVNTSLAANFERASRAIEAEAGGNHAEAIRLWRLVLGDEFPAHG